MFGAKANVYLKFEKNLEDLASVIREGLHLNDVFFKSDHDYPYASVAMSETLGFEIWIEESKEFEKFNFIITLETNIDLSKRLDNEMFDLSPWLAQYIKNNLEIETYFVPVSN